MDSIRGKIFYRRDYNKYKEIKQWSDISKWRTSLLGVTFLDYVKVLSIQGNQILVSINKLQINLVNFNNDNNFNHWKQ